MSVQLLGLFKKNLVSFFDELVDTFPNESDFVIIRVVLKDQVPAQEMMEYFIKNVLPLKEQIVKRDEKIFTESDVFYFGLDQINCKGLKGLWISNKLDKDDKEVIWKWLDTFVAIVEKYMKTM